MSSLLIGVDPCPPFGEQGFYFSPKHRGKIAKGEGIIGASLIEQGEVKEAREVMFTFGDDEALCASALRASHEPPLVNGRICFAKTQGVDRL